MKKASIKKYSPDAAYLHAGGNVNVAGNEVIGIFDLDSSTVSETGRLFLRKFESEGRSVSAKGSFPRSMILLCDTKDGANRFAYRKDALGSSRVVISPVTAQKLAGRLCGDGKPAQDA